MNLIGPGAYHKDEEFGKNSQKVSIRGKPKESRQQMSPGPGEYDSKKDSKVQGFQMDKSSRRSELISNA